MAHKLLDGATAVGVSKALTVKGIGRHIMDTVWNSTAAVEVSAVVVELQGSETGEDKDTGIIVEAGLIVGTDGAGEKIGNTAFAYQIDNVSYVGAASAGGTAITAGLDGLSATVGDYKITATKFGGFKVYVNAAGTIKVAFPALVQVYASVALASAAIDALPARFAGYIEIGKVLIDTDTGDWVAATDDMTDASDVTTATFVSLGSSFITLATATAAGAEVSNARMSDVVVNQPTRYVRVYLSTLTGTGEVTTRYTPVETRVG